ncbi:MAG: hypothetical protein J6W35_06860 [Eubacterium sp.]|nr:hypothetical protein [Eubacterium sp.]
MGIRNMFDHKYPITNLHEIDLTFMHDDIDKMISILESWEAIIEELKEGVELFEDIKQRIIVLESDVNSLKSDVIQLKSNYTYLNGEVNNIKYDLDAIKTRLRIVEITLQSVWGYIDSRIDYVIEKSYRDDLIIMNKLNQAKLQLQQQIDDLYRLIGAISTEITNEWHWGNKISIQKNNGLIYMDLADNTPTASDYQKLNLTAADYDDFMLTAREYAKYGYKMLHLDFVFSPAYGFKQEISNVLTSIINYIEGTLSASEYSSLSITADDYTALNLSASDYYSYSS